MTGLYGSAPKSKKASFHRKLLSDHQPTRPLTIERTPDRWKLKSPPFFNKDFFATQAIDFSQHELIHRKKILCGRLCEPGIP